MRRALALALLAAGCTDPRTEVVVVIDSQGLTIGSDIDAVHLLVTNGAENRFEREKLLLCTNASSVSCFQLPISLTLVPGPDHGADAVRVEVDGLRRDSKVIGDAAVFHFLSGVSQRLDFVLYANCLNVDCSAADLACDITGKCVALEPMPYNGAPIGDGSTVGGGRDLATTGGDLAGVDLAGSGDDLALSTEDLAVLPGEDLARGHDMRQSGSDMRSSTSTDMSMGSDNTLPDMTSHLDFTLPNPPGDMMIFPQGELGIGTGLGGSPPPAVP